MIVPATVVFAIAALGGVILATHVLRDRFAPWLLSVAHALLGATGLALLVVAVLQGAATTRVLAALALLGIAALGGFFLASFHLRRRIAPKAVVFVHAGVAVAGFLTLLSALLG